MQIGEGLMNKYLIKFSFLNILTLLFNFPAFADGNQLLRKCISAEIAVDKNEISNAVDAGFCLGYLNGSRNAIQVFADKGNFICLPSKGIDNGQTLRIVMKFMRENPKYLHEDELLMVAMSLKEAFPCNKN